MIVTTLLCLPVVWIKWCYIQPAIIIYYRGDSFSGIGSLLGATVKAGNGNGIGNWKWKWKQEMVVTNLAHLRSSLVILQACPFCELIFGLSCLFYTWLQICNILGHGGKLVCTAILNYLCMQSVPEWTPFPFWDYCWSTPGLKLASGVVWEGGGGGHYWLMNHIR